MRKILVTGGAGFIGSNFIHYVLQKSKDVEVVNLDSLTYAGNLENLKGLEKSGRYTFLRGSIAEAEDLEKAFSHRIDAVVNFAAESHVDRSILDPMTFVTTNILGTQRLIDFSRSYKVDRFLQVSTDEVYGSLGKTGYFHETTPMAPNSPYSASKASADLLVRAAHKTFGFCGMITRCTNNFGPYQFPEKLIPLVILNAIEEKPIPVYGDGQNIRDWIHVEDHCRALVRVLEDGTEGEVYNIGGNCERANIQVVRQILRHLEKSEELIRFVDDRPGHDRRYAMDATKIREELGFEPSDGFESALAQTIEWYQENRSWWERVRTGEYREYYEKQYADRIQTGRSA